MQQISKKAFLAALLLASPMVGAEPQYPAADFKPTVVFQDAGLIAKHAAEAKERVAALRAKPSAAAPAAEAKSAAPVESTGVGNPLTDNLPVVLIVLALVGYSFWSSKRSGSRGGETRLAATAFAGAVSGETGVARYLKSLPENAKARETGVARYLKSLPDTSKAAQTGVARYLKNLK
jgi:hypothetical protein